jgi:hypothetical protein
VQGRGGQVPGSPVRLVVQRAREPPVRGGALREGRGVVDGGADEWVGEAQAGSVNLYQPDPLGRLQGHRAWPGSSRGGCAQVRTVGHRGQQERGLRLLRQGGEPRVHDRT